MGATRQRSNSHRSSNSRRSSTACQFNRPGELRQLHMQLEWQTKWPLCVLAPMLVKLQCILPQVWKSSQDLQATFASIDEIIGVNLRRVQTAMRQARIGPHHFSGSTGYGHGDLGREAFDQVRHLLLDKRRKENTTLFRREESSGPYRAHASPGARAFTSPVPSAYLTFEQASRRGI